jgi:DNA-binding transcriptional ArsR family regulator
MHEITFYYMVEHTYDLDDIFVSLSAQTRRKILNLIANKSLTVSQIAENFKLTYGAISKHILVLERAKLVVKRREGKEQFISISPVAIEQAEECLMSYRKAWEERLDALDQFLINKSKEKHETN